MPNDSLINTIQTLRRALKTEKSAIWKAVLKELSRTRSNRREVNIDRLANVTNENDVVIVPGKILGSGNLSHKLTVWSFDISEVAAKKIIQVGGKLIPLDNLLQKYPSGKGIRIIG
jgi:large subunit ribosomal protein L18e